MFLKCLKRQESHTLEIECIKRKKLVVVGDGECGKTCLLWRFTKGTFTEDEYRPTLFEVDVVKVQHEKKQVELVLYDTAGQEDYSLLRPVSYSGADIIIMCFSLDNLDSLENISSVWWPEIDHYCKGVPIILVGTKKDLRDVPNETMVDGIENLLKDGHKHVSYAAGEKMAKKIGAIAYYETSSKFNIGVENVFTEATKTAVSLKNKKRRRGR